MSCRLFYYFPSATTPRTLIFNLYQYEVQQKKRPEECLALCALVWPGGDSSMAALTTAGLAVKLVTEYYVREWGRGRRGSK